MEQSDVLHQWYGGKRWWSLAYLQPERPSPWTADCVFLFPLLCRAARPRHGGLLTLTAELLITVVSWWSVDGGGMASKQRGGGVVMLTTSAECDTLSNATVIQWYRAYFLSPEGARNGFNSLLKSDLRNDSYSLARIALY